MLSPEQSKSLLAEWITPASFAPYGQVIWADADGKAYDNRDAQLQLDQGIPRLYIMRLQAKGTQFHQITRHQRCTQCLGALAGKNWLMAVAPPSSSSVPDLALLRAFRIPGDCFVKLALGTWHAGPYFADAFVDFYNLELSDTNEIDHETCDLQAMLGQSFEIIPSTDGP